MGQPGSIEPLGYYACPHSSTCPLVPYSVVPAPRQLPRRVRRRKRRQGGPDSSLGVPDWDSSSLPSAFVLPPMFQHRLPQPHLLRLVYPIPAPCPAASSVMASPTPLWVAFVGAFVWAPFSDRAATQWAQFWVWLVGFGLSLRHCFRRCLPRQRPDDDDAAASCKGSGFLPLTPSGFEMH